jgi:hypothetical protein
MSTSGVGFIPSEKNAQIVEVPQFLMQANNNPTASAASSLEWVMATQKSSPNKVICFSVNPNKSSVIIEWASDRAERFFEGDVAGMPLDQCRGFRQCALARVVAHHVLSSCPPPQSFVLESDPVVLKNLGVPIRLKLQAFRLKSSSPAENPMYWAFLAAESIGVEDLMPLLAGPQTHASRASAAAGGLVPVQQPFASGSDCGPQMVITDFRPNSSLPTYVPVQPHNANFGPQNYSQIVALEPTKANISHGVAMPGTYAYAPRQIMVNQSTPHLAPTTAAPQLQLKVGNRYDSQGAYAPYNAQADPRQQPVYLAHPGYTAATTQPQGKIYSQAAAGGYAAVQAQTSASGQAQPLTVGDLDGPETIHRALEDMQRRIDENQRLLHALARAPAASTNTSSAI